MKKINYLTKLGIFVSLFFTLLLSCSLTASAQSVDVDTSTGASCAIITSNLRYLTRDTNGSDNVSILQDFLNSRGYLASQPTGFFGAATRRAVIAFQNEHGLRATPPGYVGVGTRAKIQEIDCGASSSGANNNTTVAANNTGTVVSTWATTLSGWTYATTTDTNPTITIFANKDSNAQTGATTIVWNTSRPANVALDMVCQSGSLTLTTSKGNSVSCEKGGVWTWTGMSQSGDSIVVTPSGNTSPATAQFVLTVLNQNGSNYNYSNEKKTITLSFPAVGLSTGSPTIGLSAASYSITKGQSTQVAWNTANATACTAYYGGKVESMTTQGLLTVYPTETTTYRLVCTNGGYSAEKSITVTVVQPTTTTTTTWATTTNWSTGVGTPTIGLSAASYSITKGQSTQVAWNTANATACTAYYGGKVESMTTQGLLTVYPTETTTYRLVCTNGGYSAEKSITVTVTGGTTTSAIRPSQITLFVDAMNDTVLSATPFTVRWSGNNSPTSYNVKINNTVIPQGANTTWTGTAASLGLGSGLHTFYAQACNAAGCSDWSYSPMRTLTVTDSATVASTLAAPSSVSVDVRVTNGAVLATTPFTITWSGNNSPTSYNVKINNTVIPQGANTTWTGTAASLGLSNGAHSIYVQACNAKGCSNWSPSPDNTFIVTTDPAVIAVAAAPTQASLDVRMTGTTILATAPFTVTWSGNNSPSSYIVKIDNTELPQGTNTTWTGTAASLGLALGAHTISVKACNARGCSSFSPVFSFTVNGNAENANATAVPIVGLSASSYSIISGQKVSIAWNTTDATSCTAYYGGRVEGVLAQGLIDTYPSETTTYRLVCSNSVNSAEKSITVNVTPVSTVVAPSRSEIYLSATSVTPNTTFTVNWSGNNSPSRYIVKINNIEIPQGANTTWTGTAASLGLTAGSHLFSAQACNVSGCSGWSGAQILTITSPTSLSNPLLQSNVVLGASTADPVSNTVSMASGMALACLDIKSELLHLERNDRNTKGEVTQLQQFLIERGYLKKEATGYYGKLTSDAVKEYQRSKGIAATGYVGALTKEAIRSSTCR